MQFIKHLIILMKIYFEVFVKDAKSVLNYFFKKSSNLNFMDSQNILSNFEIEYVLDKTEFYDFFLKLCVLHIKALFFLYIINNLNLLLLVGYCLIGLLVSYVLYKKLKFVYHCYKTKTLKVTFLN